MNWIALTLFAAFMQSWRNAWQKSLSTSVRPLGVTLARFIFAAPLAVFYVAYLQWTYEATPVSFGWRFALVVMVAAISQIIATALMVVLFRRRNYAIGVGLAKSEAIIAALLAVWFLHEALPLLGWLGVLIGGIAVFLLSGVRRGVVLDAKTLLIGVACGLFFALTSLLVREATGLLPTLPHMLRAAWVLMWVLLLQSLVLLAWLSLFDRASLRGLCERIGLVLAVSIVGFAASVGWFSAMSMQSVALVKTLGQIEVWFTLLISARLFKEPLHLSDKLGLLLIVIGAILVIWA